MSFQGGGAPAFLYSCCEFASCEARRVAGGCASSGKFVWSKVAAASSCRHEIASTCRLELAFFSLLLQLCLMPCLNSVPQSTSLRIVPFWISPRLESITVFVSLSPEARRHSTVK